MPIHPTAVIDQRAEVHPDADIGPFVVIDAGARIGPRTRLHAHVTITGWTTLGADNVVHSGAVIGGPPQDLAYDGSESYVRIGDRNIIRESVHIHRGTQPGSATVLGDDNFLMSNAHLGHDCRLGNRVIIATGGTLGGHVQVEDQVFISGNCVVHQFVRVGRLAFLRGLSRTSRDVPPFCMMDWTHTVRGLNRVGLRRAGFSGLQIRALQRAFVCLFRRPRNLRLALQELETGTLTAEVRYLTDFIHASQRGICMGPRQQAAD